MSQGKTHSQLSPELGQLFNLQESNIRTTCYTARQTFGMQVFHNTGARMCFALCHADVGNIILDFASSTGIRWDPDVFHLSLELMPPPAQGSMNSLHVIIIIHKSNVIIFSLVQTFFTFFLLYSFFFFFT